MPAVQSLISACGRPECNLFRTLKSLFPRHPTRLFVRQSTSAEPHWPPRSMVSSGVVEEGQVGTPVLQSAVQISNCSSPSEGIGELFKVSHEIFLI